MGENEKRLAYSRKNDPIFEIHSFLSNLRILMVELNCGYAVLLKKPALW